MALFKCKMCGGNIEFNPGDTVGICDSCGTKQTLPKLDDDRRANLYDRANHFRRNNEFDKAMSIYEKILEEDNTDAETYWSIVLCRYGIEYVEDPATHKRVPTVNRAQYSSVVSDKDYKSALKYGTPEQKELYKAEARAIDKIQKGILEISQKEEPFDVFICYKETDNQGRRTPDSVLANDLYHQLVQEGFKVFFSRITLEDKLGTAYEPYIFAALNSAKVMVVLGTKPEYFNAVWVKNEWNRYLALVNASGGKKMLIPAYKDMDPYDLPEEFSHLQAQDMSKLGFMQDLIRGIKKIVSADAPTTVVKETPAVTATVSASVNVAPLLERAFMFLEDGEWEDADAYCEKVLDQDPKNAQAYLGKLMAELHVRKQSNLADLPEPFYSNSNFQKFVRFGDEKSVSSVKSYNQQIIERNENNRKLKIYNDAVNAMNAANTESAYKSAAESFKSISEYKDADELAKKCLEYAETCRKAQLYNVAKSYMTGFEVEKFEKAIKYFESLSGWKDSDEQVSLCRQIIEEIKAKEEADRLEAERKAERARIAKEKAKQKTKKILKIAIPAVAALIVFIIILNTVILPSVKYKKAMKLLGNHNAISAMGYLNDIGNYKNSKELMMNFSKNSISAGGWHTVGLKSDGAIKSTDSNYDSKSDAADWKDIVAISAGYYHTVGLKSDGMVVSSGFNNFGQCNVADWKDIVAISAGNNHTVGLKSDGTVIATGSNDYGQCNIADWKDIVAISAGNDHTVGLKSDGTVIATGSNGYGQCNVDDWKDIVAISAGGSHSVGLKSDGTVVAVGANQYGQCDVKKWNDVAAISAGVDYTVGLKSDGSVIATGSDDCGQCDVKDWKDIVVISAGNDHTVGLKSDGTVIATGSNGYGQCDVAGWKDIKVPKK